MDLWLGTRRTLNEQAKICHAGTYLSGAALNWFNGLNFGLEREAYREEEQSASHGQQSSSTGSYSQSTTSTARQPSGPETPRIESYQAFRRLFLERFKRHQEEQREVKASLWEIRQDEGQSTEDFVNAVRNKGELCDANDEEMYTAAISGLRTDVKAGIMVGKQPKDLDELIRWGTNYEKYNNKTMLGGVSSMIKTVNETMAKLTTAVRPLEAVKEPERRERSPSPARPILKNVGWDDSRERSQSRDRSQSASPPETNWSPRFNQRDQQRGMWRGGSRGRGDGRGGRSWNDRPFQPGQGYNQGSGRGGYQGGSGTYQRGAYQESYYAQNPGVSNTGRFGGPPSPQGNMNAQANGDCGNCGWSHPFAACPAAQTNCTGCGLKGHWKRRCRVTGGGNRY